MRKYLSEWTLKRVQGDNVRCISKLTVTIFLLFTITTSPLLCMTDEKTPNIEKQITHEDMIMFRGYFYDTIRPYQAIPNLREYHKYTDLVQLSNAFHDAMLQAFDACFAYARKQMLNEEKVIACLADDVIKKFGFDLEIHAYEMSPGKERTTETRTLLHHAAETGRLNIIRTLCLAGAKIDAQSHRKRTPLHFAAENGHVATCKLLLDLKAPIDGKDRYEQTPLHYAAKADHQQVCETLIAAGANRKAQDWCGGGIGQRGYPEDYATGETLEAFKD